MKVKSASSLKATRDAEWAGVTEGPYSSQHAAQLGFPDAIIINRVFFFSSLKTYRISNYDSYFPKGFF